MYKTPLYIVILDNSKIIIEGIHSILIQSDLDCRLYKIEKFEELSTTLKTKRFNILIANPIHFVNREKEIKKIRSDNPTLSIVGIDFGMMQKIHSDIDTTFTLYDSPDRIIQLLTKLNNKTKNTSKKKVNNDILTKREIEVLNGIVNGQMNKEIADSLGISIHTVVRHRKNITLKTGIRSQSGLTIYAITKKIVDIEDFDV